MKFTLIGCGNLGSALIKGIVSSDLVSPEDITVTDKKRENLEEIEQLGVRTTTDNKEAVKQNEMIFLAIKPDKVGEVLEKLELTEEKLVISLAAGVTTDYLQEYTDARIIRVMPNLAGEVGEMASAYTLGPKTKPEDEESVKAILNELGKTVKVEEDLMNPVTALSGSGPAFVFIMIKALRDAGIEMGLSEENSSTLAAQTVKGAAEMTLQSEKSLEEFIDMVCSPKGTTIEGVEILEDEKALETYKKAVKAAFERAEELSK